MWLIGVPNIEIVVVAPSVPPDQTERGFDEIGLKVCLIEMPHCGCFR
jgi:hypothetical protein